MSGERLGGANDRQENPSSLFWAARLALLFAALVVIVYIMHDVPPSFARVVPLVATLGLWLLLILGLVKIGNRWQENLEGGS